MILLPEGDPATACWLELHHTARFLVRTLPHGNGMAYALQAFLDAEQEVAHDTLSLYVRDLRPYFAAQAVDALAGIEGTVGSSQANFSYLEGAYYGYRYLHGALRWHHGEQYQTLAHVWRSITQAHIEAKGAYRDVLGYIRSDIEKMRHPTLHALRKDLLTYLGRIRQSSLANETKQQTVLACCFVLGSFH